MLAVKESFNVTPDAEITVECNPNLDYRFFEAAMSAGVNRLSFGVQAGDDGRLKTLGRTHTVADAEKAVRTARDIGFDNISCDLMIALPDSNAGTLTEDIDFICSLSPEHVSAYILKIEEKTSFFKLQKSLKLPDEDEAANQYLLTCEEFEKRGFEHYEISNFAKPGRESRHNLKYWRCEEYLGLGPSAHSFLGGRRFYYPRDTKAFMNGCLPVPDGTGGDREEKIMLGLRLSEGVSLSDFGFDVAAKTERLQSAGLVRVSGDRLSLTDKGMLVSNSIITELLYENV